MAMFLAMVLTWMGGAWSGAQLGNLGGEPDRGLVGASAERASAEALPNGKPSAEAESEESRSEREIEEDGHEFATPWLARTGIEPQAFLNGGVHEVDLTSSSPTRLLLANIGARGPPVG